MAVRKLLVSIVRQIPDPFGPPDRAFLVREPDKSVPMQSAQMLPDGNGRYIQALGQICSRLWTGGFQCMQKAVAGSICHAANIGSFTHKKIDLLSY